MKRLSFIKRLTGGLAALAMPAAASSTEIRFEDLLYHPYPNKHLGYLKPGKYKDFLLARISLPVEEKRGRPVYHAAHGYKIPPVFKSEEELFDHLKLMAHELNKHQRGTNYGDKEQFRFMKAFYKEDTYQLQWF